MLPRKLKNLTLFNDGNSYLGQVTEVTLPKLERNFEEYRGGGMDGPLKIDMGQKAIDFEWKCGGHMREPLRQYGAITVAANQLRFVGAYQSDQTGSVDAVEIVIRGRHEEIDQGKAKAGDDTEYSVKTACAYYKQSCNGQVDVEIDFLNMVFIVGGVDRLQEIRDALGASGGSLSSLVSGPSINIPNIPGLGDIF